MPLASCPRCNQMFDKQDGITVCEECTEAEATDIERIADFVSKHPDVSPHAVASALDIDHQIVLRAVDGGHIAQVNPKELVRCGRCGAPAISHSKKLCEACLAELDAQISRERASIKIPNKDGREHIRDEVQKRRIT